MKRKKPPTPDEPNLVTRLLDEKVRDAHPDVAQGDMTNRELIYRRLARAAAAGDKQAKKLFLRMRRESPEVAEKLRVARTYAQPGSSESGVIQVPYMAGFVNCPYHLALAEAAKARKEGRPYRFDPLDPSQPNACSDACPDPTDPGLLPLPDLDEPPPLIH
ncbi:MULTISPECIES: hypothetical protein [unclassified Methylibium]|uniref:hypothetical protein n=1 Tax=unclassified Methylibium TaxID=2633235 RepID=UPI0003F407E6|nr:MULTISPECIES: hypothetical protein [unclassified Methylibium]EWS54899.1 hypothetical protein X551_02294 [Methylibium sp. T29]EWS61746.1 hypothetical protein Y694_00532 [Methylibium sp. T29-B]